MIFYMWKKYVKRHVNIVSGSIIHNLLVDDMAGILLDIDIGNENTKLPDSIL